MRARVIFRWFDLWIGFYWDRIGRRLYVFPVPMLGLELQFSGGRPGGPRLDVEVLDLLIRDARLKRNAARTKARRRLFEAYVDAYQCVRVNHRLGLLPAEPQGQGRKHGPDARSR